MIVCQSLLAQTAMLYKSGNDTLVTLPIEQIENINKQLSDSRKVKIDYLRLYKAWKYQKNLNDTLGLKLVVCDSTINALDSVIEGKNNIIKKNHQDYMKLVYRYERAEKKNKKYKSTSAIVGSILLILNLVVLSIK